MKIGQGGKTSRKRGGKVGKGGADEDWEGQDSGGDGIEILQGE